MHQYVHSQLTGTDAHETIQPLPQTSNVPLKVSSLAISSTGTAAWLRRFLISSSPWEPVRHFGSFFSHSLDFAHGSPPHPPAYGVYVWAKERDAYNNSKAAHVAGHGGH